MNDHIPDATKMISDTPRTDAHNWKDGDYDDPLHAFYDFAGQLERELNAANEMFRKLNIHALNLADRIKRLEEAGDALYENSNPSRWDLPEAAALKLTEQSNWIKAKEAKP
jgi:hypothetical protein